MAKNHSTRAAIRAALEEVPEDFYNVDELLTEKVTNPLTPLRFVAATQEEEELAGGPYDDFDADLEVEEYEGATLPHVLRLDVHDADPAHAVEFLPASQEGEDAFEADHSLSFPELGQIEAITDVAAETIAQDGADSATRESRRRGWFGLSRRGSAKPAAITAPAALASPSPVHEPVADVAPTPVREKVRDDVYAGTLERDEARRRFAALEADLRSEQEARAHAETAAEHLRNELDEVRSELFAERQARAAADAAAQFAQEQLDTLSSAHAAMSAEHDEVIAAYAQLDEQRRTERDALTQWESHARELHDTLEHEREEFLRTLEDERHTAEQARAAQAFQHREQLETHAAHTATTIAAVEKQLAATQATLEATNAELGATRAEVVRITEDLQAARGEAEAANARAREEGELRVRAEQRLEEVQDELAYVRSEVMGGRNDKKKGGLLRRGAKPSPLKSLEPQSRPIAQAPRSAAPTAPVSEELDEILERRLFGDG
jgi:hypothetical protein